MDLVADLYYLVYINDRNRKGLLHLALPSMCDFRKCYHHGELLRFAMSRVLRILFVQHDELRRCPSTLGAGPLSEVFRRIRACNESIVMLEHFPAGPSAILGDLSGVLVGVRGLTGLKFLCLRLRDSGIHANLLGRWDFLFGFMKTPVVMGFWLFPLLYVLESLVQQPYWLSLQDENTRVLLAHVN